MTQLQKVIRDSQGVWKNESQFFAWLRGQLRRSWAKHPVKSAYLESKQYPVPEHLKEKYTKQTKWLVDCELCGQSSVKSKIQVDHKVPAGSLKSIEDVLQFIYRLIFICWDDIRILCKPCHAIVTLSDRLNISFEEAKIEKQIIAFSKLPVTMQVMELFELTGSGGQNAKQRKECYRKHLKELHERSQRRQS